MRAASSLLRLLTLGCTSVCVAQGTISDGNTSWSLGAFPPPGIFAPQFADLSASPCVTDILRESRWLWRTNTDLNARPFLDQNNAAFTSSFLGNAAQMDWSDVDLAGLVDARWAATVRSTGADSGFVEHVMTLTNISTTPFVGRLFFYADFDFNNSVDDDLTLPASSGPDRIQLGDDHPCGGCAEMYGVDATAYEVAPWFDLIQRIQFDGTTYSLANAGLPFGPGDFTGAFEWDVVVPAGGQFAATVYLGHNDAFADVTASATNSGTATPGAAGAPTLTPVAGVPVLGAPYGLALSEPSGQAVSGSVLFGLGPQVPVPFCGITLHIGAPIAAVTVPMAGGAGTLELGASCDPTLLASSIQTQLFVADATGPCGVDLPLVASDLLTLVFGD